MSMALGLGARALLMHCRFGRYFIIDFDFILLLYSHLQ